VTGYRILVVDDDDLQREGMATYLTLAGFGVEVAASGSQALGAMAVAAPDLVILDVQMPDLDGVSVFRTMRRTPAFAEIPVVFLSSLDAPHVRIRALEMGAEDFISKPAIAAELVARVRAGLRRAARYQRRRSVLTGQLSPGVLTLDEVLQTLQIGMRAARVHLRDLPAEIDCEAGEITACTFRSFAGQDALARVMLATTTSFEVEVEPHPAPRDGHLSLMAAMVEIDEVGALLAAVLPGGEFIALSADASDPELTIRRALFPGTRADLLASFPGSLRSAAAALAAAARRGELTVIE